MATSHQAVIFWGEGGRTLVLRDSDGFTSMSLQDFSPNEEESLGSVSLENFASVQDLEADAFPVWTQSARRAVGDLT